MPNADGHYEVTAVEHSGLESRRSDGLPPPAPAELRAAALDPFTVRLTWTTSARNAGIAHYNVYAGLGAVKVEQARLIASPGEPTTIDWGLRAGKDYRYLVTAVDRAGHESAPSPEAAMTTPAIAVEQQHIPVGQVLDKDATVRFQVPTEGEYLIWVELAAGAARRHLPLALVFDGAEQTWSPFYDLVSEAHAGPLPGVPFFEPLPAAGVDMRHPLAAGEHTLIFRAAKGAPVLKSILVTNDRGFTPPGIISFLAPKAQATRAR